MGDFCLKVGLVGIVSMVIGGCMGQKSAPVEAPPSPSASLEQRPTLVNPSSPSVPSLSPVLKADLPDANRPGDATTSSETTPAPSLLKKIKQDLSLKVAIAKQDTGKTALSNLLRSQQAEKLVKGRFTADLKRISEDIPLETDEYRLEVRQADEAKAIVVAIAKQPGFASYTGAVYATEGKIPITSICKTNVPSQTPPQPPKIVKAGLMCESGSSTTN
jgi:Type IV pilin-like G and H, putative